MGITQLTSRSASWQTQIHAQTTSYTSAQTAQAGEKKDDSTDLYEMMRDAREKADARREQYKLPKNTRYGDAPMLAYARLARARTPGEVSAASGYARRKIVQLQSALRSDPDNKERIQAAIRQLQKAVRRAGKKQRDVQGEKLAERILRRLRFDNETIRQVRRLVLCHDDRQENPTARWVRRAVFRIGEDLFPYYLEVRRADILAQNPAFREKSLKNLEQVEALYRNILEEKNCVSLKGLAVTGHDLIEAGVEPGKPVGETLNRLLELVMDHPEYNKKEYLLEQIKRV